MQTVVVYVALGINLMLEAFSETWDDRSPSISRSWRDRWANVIPFFAYPPAIRKVIYTTNAIESINDSSRR